MKNSVNLKPVLTFLKDLEQNNNKPWFDAHRERYEAAKDDFTNFVQVLIGEIDKFDSMGSLDAKECISRIYRDTRFSKDKSPYKNNFSAAIAPGGRKSTRVPYYLHVTPGNRSVLAGGIYMPEPEQPRMWRDAIDRDPTRLKKIINAKVFVENFGRFGGEKLATAPKGYPRDHPDIELLKLTRIVAWRDLTDREVLAPDLVKQAAQSFRALKPFLNYLDTIMPRMKGQT